MYDYKGLSVWKRLVASEALWQDFCMSRGLNPGLDVFMRFYMPLVRPYADRVYRYASYRNRQGEFILRPRRGFVRFKAGPTEMALDREQGAC